MSVENKTQIKTYFQLGDQPTEAQFVNLIDSYFDYTDGQTLSGDFSNLNTFINQNSANWEESTDISYLSGAIDANTADITNISTISGNWNSVYTTVQNNSATTWNYQGTDLKSLSANWQNTYTIVNTNSSGWESTETTVNTNSANWSSVYTTVQSNSAGWESTETTVNSNSANWNSAYAVTTGINNYARLDGTNMPFTSAQVTGNFIVDTNTLYVDANTNRVGVGTTNPTYQLEVGDGTGQKTELILGGLSATNPVYGGQLIVGNSTYDGRFGNINPLVGGDTGTNDIYLKSQSSDLRIGTETSGKDIKLVAGGWAAEKMIIKSSGNVGIGTSNPTYKLEVSNGPVKFERTVASDAATLDMVANSTYLRIGKEGSGGGGGLMSGSLSGAGIINVQDARPLQFGTGNLPRMTIRESGNVGIGTTNPGVGLEVVGTVRSNTIDLTNATTYSGTVTAAGIYLTLGINGSALKIPLYL
jgi:hypothetical protein